MRETLIDLFDREFVEPQEALGISVLGQFRVLDDPNRFLWLRAFPDMAARAHALKAFYGGPVWKAHREAANATMIDSNNVLLLRPAHLDSDFLLSIAERSPLDGGAVTAKLITVTIYYFETAAPEEAVRRCEGSIEAQCRDAGASVLATFVTDNSRNDYPALPVREGENVLVVLSSYPDLSACERHAAGLPALHACHDVTRTPAQRLKAGPEVWKLSPTSRSRIR